MRWCKRVKRGCRMVQNDRIILDAATRGDLPVEEQQKLLALVDRFYPAKSGMVRRIHRVWGDYLRINFHALDNEFKIAESHFVNVNENQLVEMN